ncbi:MAG: hypothetical protein NKF70_11645 [Methanobacterium sp. ERen5]|nr:MAG: hypothetical protein NKF70_11645 [Methanobacterium sp. ERen5]
MGNYNGRHSKHQRKDILHNNSCNCSSGPDIYFDPDEKGKKAQKKANYLGEELKLKKLELVKGDMRSICQKKEKVDKTIYSPNFGAKHYKNLLRNVDESKRSLEFMKIEKNYQTLISVKKFLIKENRNLKWMITISKEKSVNMTGNVKSLIYLYLLILIQFFF